MRTWDAVSFAAEGEDDDDLPPGWGEEEEEDSPPPPMVSGRAKQAAQETVPRSRVDGGGPEASFAPSMFTNAPSQTDSKGRKKKPPLLPWLVTDEAKRRQTCKRHRLLPPAADSPSDGQTLEDVIRRVTPDSDSGAHLRQALKILRAKKKRVPLEETLAGLETLQSLQRQCRAPPLPPLDLRRSVVARSTSCGGVVGAKGVGGGDDAAAGMDSSRGTGRRRRAASAPSVRVEEVVF